MTNIVTVNVSQTAAPLPSQLQGTGVLVSQGGTNLAPGTMALLTQLSDLTPLVPTLTPITSITSTSNLATVTYPANTFPSPSAGSEPMVINIVGAVPAAYNGVWFATVTSPTTLTFTIFGTVAAATTPGTISTEDVPELLAMATTFFAQGNTCSVAVLELGLATPVAGVAALAAWITANPGQVYSFLVPREWDIEPTFPAFLSTFQALTAKTYFFITTTVATRGNYTNLQKCAFTVIEAPGIPVTEFTAAAFFYVTLNYNPSPVNMVTPLSFAYLFGVTPFPIKGNSALLATLKAAYVNVVGTGAEGGITTAVALYGTTMDGRPFNYWYAVDWAIINCDLDVANEVINGSNNPQAPLYYSQPGIDRLKARAQKTINRGVSYGLILPGTGNTGPAVTAIPFAVYVNNAPGDFRIGKYSGLGVSMTPQRGFDKIFFALNVTDFVVQ